jgi:hypothetical protein
VAYIVNPNEQKEEELGMNSQQQAPAQNQQPAQPQQVASGVESEAAPAPMKQQSETKGPKAASSGATGMFQQYQKANQGTAQNRLGQAVQSNLQKNVGQAQGALQRGQSNFQQLMEKGTLANRQNAVQDVNKAATQARNIYTGNLEADKAAKQGLITQTQNQAQTLQNFKESETQRIGQERVANAAAQKKQYDDNLAAAQAEYDKQYQIGQSSPQVTLNDYGSAQVASNMAAQLDAQRKLEAAKKANFFDSGKENTLKQAEEALKYSDFNIAQNQDQTKAAQKALDELNSRQFTSGVDPETQQRFAEIINARYRGPESLRGTGAYDEALNRVNKAQDLATMSKTAGGREDLLAQLYGRPGTEYSRGMSRLDAALLNTNKDAMQGIQDQTKQLGGMRDQLSRANVDTQIAARNRAADIANVVKESKDTFTKQQEAEKALTEGRLDEAIKSGNEFAQYFKDQLSGKTGTTNLNPYEAALLGVSSGEGLYNMGGDAVKIANLERGKMISQDEFARQKALADLAQLDQSKGLNSTLKYNDQSLAGTQSAVDALDVAGTRAALNDAEQSFRTDAEGANLVGTGKGKASKGNWMGKKTKTASTTIKNNVARMLESAGYDMNSEVGQNMAKSILSNEQATSKFLTGANRGTEVSADGTLQGAATGAATGASIGSVVPVVGTGLGAAIGASLGGYVGGGTLDPYQQQEEVFRSLGLEPVADVYRGGRDALATNLDAQVDAANLLTAGGLKGIPGISDLTSGLSSALRGIDSSALAKKAKQRANEAAKANLLKNYQNYLSGQGFSNRIGVSATDKAATDRLAGLQQLLARLDKTNVGNSAPAAQANLLGSKANPQAAQVGQVPYTPQKKIV